MRNYAVNREQINETTVGRGYITGFFKDRIS